jgi:hypothetical protein
MILKQNNSLTFSFVIISIISLNAPFLNQLVVNYFGFPIYLGILIITFFFSVYLINMRIILSNYLLGLVFTLFNFFIVLGFSVDHQLSTLIIFLYFYISLVLVDHPFVSSEKFISRFPYYLFILTLLILIFDIQNFWLNYLENSRTKTMGSILGYSCFLGVVLIILWRSFLLQKKLPYILMYILLFFFSVVFVKTKGSLLIVFIITILMKSNFFYKIVSSFLILVGTYVFSSFRVLTGDGSISVRLDIFKRKIYEIFENILSFNLFNIDYLTRDGLFHNWILELWFKISFFSIILILCYVFVFMYAKKSIYFKWLIVYFFFYGLISFKLDDIVYSLSICSALALAEHNSYKKRDLIINFSKIL